MDDAPVYAATGNGTSILSNRISYFLDINGPSMTIDTGCSASLVCVHNACQSLRTGEVDMVSGKPPTYDMICDFVSVSAC